MPLIVENATMQRATVVDNCSNSEIGDENRSPLKRSFPSSTSKSANANTITTFNTSPAKRQKRQTVARIALSPSRGRLARRRARATPDLLHTLTAPSLLSRSVHSKQ
jgi:hypothetical protein